MSPSSAPGKGVSFEKQADQLEDEILHGQGVNSLDPMDPLHRPKASTPAAPMVSVTAPSAAPVSAPAIPKSALDAQTGAKPSAASDILAPFNGIRIQYAARRMISSYFPSARMMFYLIHLINDRLVDHYYFKRYCPDYHPYIFRLYCGILFYIQCLRAASDVAALPDDQHQFLIRFLQAYPPESLPIPGQLLVLFKSLCTSEPEITSYGKVFPRIPESLGPDKRSKFWTGEVSAYMQPNIPGIFALLEDLQKEFNRSPPIYPKKGKHIPVTKDSATPEIFGHHTFPAHGSRSTSESWSLTSAGLDYPCEADSKLNEAFSERLENFGFPTTTANDDLTSIQRYLSMSKSIAWFANVRDVADCIASYCENSGTLADCSPAGIPSNQTLVVYSKPEVAISVPTHVGDPKSLFPFSFHLSTTARSPPNASVLSAAAVQTNVRMYATHPFAGSYGDNSTRIGKFWDIRPIEKSDSDTESYLGLIPIVRKEILSRI
jgi:hypothetical protein